EEAHIIDGYGHRTFLQNSLGEMIRHGISNSWLEDSLYFYFLLRLKIIFSCSQGAECEKQGAAWMNTGVSGMWLDLPLRWEGGCKHRRSSSFR
ncbi:hypothetical protein, partial [Moorella sp. Hama-1]|uniref:hypothetical protein n=1 Tax=Moorella sp. Hama-1 TaxID=2138101 RepID=UPI001F26B798